MTAEAPLLSVRDLSVRFESEEGQVAALTGVSFDVPRHSTVAMVGESGSGKSVTALSILRLLQEPPARITGGSVMLDGENLLAASERRMRAIRGARIGIVFQDPLAALNPVYPVGAQVADQGSAVEREGRHVEEGRRRCLRGIRPAAVGLHLGKVGAVRRAADRVGAVDRDRATTVDPSPELADTALCEGAEITPDDGDVDDDLPVEIPVEPSIDRPRARQLHTPHADSHPRTTGQPSATIELRIVAGPASKPAVVSWSRRFTIRSTISSPRQVGELVGRLERGS